MTCRPPLCAHVGAAGAEGVDLVEEQHAGRVAARLLEELVQVPLAVADPHVEHVVDADREEAGVDLAGGGAGEVGLAAAGRAVHQDAAADRFAVGLVKLGVRAAGWMILSRISSLTALHAADVLQSDFRPDFAFSRRRFILP